MRIERAEIDGRPIYKRCVDDIFVELDGVPFRPGGLARTRQLSGQVATAGATS
jgi:hypothetical protein